MPFLMPLLPYIGAALLAIGGLTWLHHEWTAPYEAALATKEQTITELKTAAADREKIEGEDRRRAEANATRAEELQAELDKIVKDAKPGACRLSDDERLRLQQLAKRAK